ncbi:MAG: dihydrolipoyl dehydrogenase [Planctomycetota bacterium]
MAKFDVVVVGAGPGGYVAAIKAAQNGKRVGLIEKEALGGVCLNWGCIPTKALIKSAEVYESIAEAQHYGISVGKVDADFSAIIKRSRSVADGMSKGIDYLMRKNGINVILGSARFVSNTHLEVHKEDGSTEFLSGDAIILATGARARNFPNLPIDDDRVFNYRRAMHLDKQPKSLLCIGAGAIGMEFAYFYNTIGTEVHVVEMVDQVLPLEDPEIAAVVDKSFRRAGVHIHTGTVVDRLEVQKSQVKAHLRAAGSQDEDAGEVIAVERVLVAVGMVPNTDGLGLEDAGIATDQRGFVTIDAFCRTSAPGVYAIGDVAGGKLLAHKASYEGEIAVAHICGEHHKADYTQVPACTYCSPQVASVGLSEQAAKDAGHQVVIGRFNFQASGKAKAIGDYDGFVKLVFDREHMQLLGAHIVGPESTELLSELSVALRLESTAEELATTIHAHPTLSEAVMEAAADALGRCVHQ